MKILNGWPTQTPEAVPSTQNVGAPKGAAAATKGGMLSYGREGPRGGELLWTAGVALQSSGAGVVVAAVPPGPWALLGVPSSLVLKPYLVEQNADRHIRHLDSPDHHAGASEAPIRQPAWPPCLWSAMLSAAPAGPFSANESLGPGKRGGALRATRGPKPSIQPTDFQPPP